MARRALVEILADASGFIHGLNQSGRATQAFSADLGKLAVNARASAAAQVQASVRKTERLRTEVLAYKAVAASAVRGSQEQVAAANLAARAEGRLAGSMGVAAHEAARLRSHAGGLERDIGRASRGALAGSGVFRTFGRSLAFASGGFLLFASAGQAVRSSIDAARQAGVTQKQLAAQFVASGLNLKTYQGQIDKTTGRLSALAGVTKDDLDAAFTTIFRGAGNVSKALKDTALAADIAAGRHIALSTAAVAVGKAAAGSTTALRRLGIELPKGATGAEAIALAMRKFKGQAAAAATEQDKFNAIAHNSEVIIGTGILPTLNQYLAQGARWLQQMNQSGRLQHDVNTIMKDAKQFLHDAGVAAKFLRDRLHDLDRITGSFENTLKILLGLKVASKLAAWSVGIGRIGSASAVAAGEVGRLEAALVGLTRVGPAAIAVMAAWAAYESVTTKTYPGAKPTAANDANSTSAGVYTYQRDGKYFEVFPGGRPGRGKEITKAQFDAMQGRPDVSGDSSVTGGRGQHGALRRDRHDGTTAASTTAARRSSTLQGRFNLADFALARATTPAQERNALVREAAITREQEKQAKTLADKTKYAQQLKGVLSQIQGIDQASAAAAKTSAAAAKKRRDDARKARESFTVPLALQLAQAKADAIASGTGATDLTKGQRAALTAMRSAAQKALRSHRLALQGQIDAFNEITSVNQQLATAGKGAKATYHRMSSVAFTRGIHYASVMDRKLAEERYAQASAHRGFVPSGPAAQGQPVVIHNLHLHGVHDHDKLWSELEKVGKRRGQRRGTR